VRWSWRTGTHTDFRKPSILIYEPQPDGSLELIAVENLVFADAWRAGREQRPSFHGVPYDSMADDPKTPGDEAHMFEPHFNRHVWIYRANPEWGVHAVESSRDVRESSIGHDAG
jgi:hypothetical protein